MIRPPTGGTHIKFLEDPVAEYALAMLVDFENMARPGAKSRGDFDITLVLDRLNEKGRVIVKRAYADWSRYREAKHQLQNAGLELIEMPSAREGAKNRADIKLAVDAMELAYSREHVDNFVIVSGDSDFTPLVGKLRELNKRVIGVGNRESTSDLLIANCDEFIFYDSIAGARGSSRRGSTDVAAMLRDTLTALQREGVEWPLASVVKDSMRRKNPAFDERDAGFGTFSKLLDDASARGHIRLETDPRSGTYRVELADSTAGAPTMSPTEDRSETDRGGRRRRRRPPRGAEEGRTSEQDDRAALGDIPEGAEVFEVVVEATPDPGLGDLPPVGVPISYEDMILMGPDIDAEIPELIEQSDLDRVEAAQPSRGSRRRRRRFSGDDEPTAADLSDLREDEDDVSSAGSTGGAAVLVLERMSADEIRAAFDAGEPVYFTVEGVDHATIESLGVATPDGEQVLRTWTSASGKVSKSAAKTFDLAVKYHAAGRKGAAFAVRPSVAEPEVVSAPEPVAVVATQVAMPPASASETSEESRPGRRRRRSRPVEESTPEATPADIVTAPVEVAEPAPTTDSAPDADVAPTRRRGSRRVTPNSVESGTEAAASAPPSEASGTDDTTSGTGRRRRRRTSPPPAE